MALRDRFRRQGRDEERGRPGLIGAARQMLPREQQGWGQMPPGGRNPWDSMPADDGRLDIATAEDPAIDYLTRTRTAEEDEAFRKGEQMGADSLMEMAGLTPFRRQQVGMDSRLMNRERLIETVNLLMKYKQGKASVDGRVVRAQQWWKLRNWEQIRAERGVQAATTHPSNTGWLWNCIVGKHADAIDSFPEPIILPRMQDDKEEANKLTSIVPVVMEMNDFEETYNDAMWQKMQEGTGVYGIFWNSSKMNGLGDIDIKKVNILNLYWEPGVTDIQDSRNVFYVSFEDKRDMISRYPELEGRVDHAYLSVRKYKTDDAIDDSDKIPVVDWYYKIHEPGGATVLHYCKFAGEVCLYSSEEEGLAEGFYEDGMYPFVLDPLYPVEGSPAGYGYIDIARDAQSDIDTLSQAMVLNAAAGATPRYFLRKDGGVNEKEFADFSKPIVHVNGNLGQDSIRPIEYAKMTSFAQQMLQQKIDEIKFVTGNTDVNNGGVPSGVTAASAIAALKEDSGRSSKDSTKAAYRAYRKIVTMVIERIRQFYDIPRQFRIIGQQDGQEQFETYNNAGLRMQETQNLPGMEPGLRLPVFDIEVRAQRENAYTKMSQNELALQFWSNGLLNPQTRDQAMIVLDMMDFRGKDELKQKLEADGLIRDTLVKVCQIALQLAVKYDPMAAEQLAQITQGVMTQVNMMPQTGGGGDLEALQHLPDDASDAIPESGAKENGIVRNARERAANASRPD